MAFPKKIKKDLKITPDKILLERREELLEFIQDKGTYLPKSVMHADLDRGMLDFVKEKLATYVDGEKFNTVDVIITTQNWIQFTETWNFQDLDKNINAPFVTTIRQSDVKYGSNPSLQYTIPNRKQFYYAKVPTWDGQRKGIDIYKIPQPVPVDITYNLKVFCTKMRHINEFNKVVMQTFSSRQAYANIKGHFIPIILNNVTDESVLDVEKRKYYVQNYEFLMMGFLLDEDEFEVVPAITRALALYEIEGTKKKSKKNNSQPNPDRFDLDIIFNVGVDSLSETYPYRVDIFFSNKKNIEEYTIYINNNLIGTDITEVQINTNDVLTVNVVKIDETKPSSLKSQCRLL